MTNNSDGTPQHPPKQPEDDTAVPDEATDIHPAVDPREPSAPLDALHPHEAPPVDIDEREPFGASHATPPDVIALSESADEIPEPGPESFVPENDDVASEWLDDELVVASDSQDDALVDGGPALEPDAEDSSAMTDDLTSQQVASDQFDEPDVESTAKANQATEIGANHDQDSPLGKATAAVGGAASRIGLGRLFKPTDESGGPTGDAEPDSFDRVSGSKVGRSVRRFVDPRLQMLTTIPHRRVFAGGLVLVLLALLANSGGLGLIILSSIVPLLILITITQHDVFEKEANVLIGAVTAAGMVIGIILSAFASWIHGSQWFDSGRLNFGAGGFGGRFADAAGGAPFIVWLMVGLVIPAMALAGMAGVPIAMRRWPQFRNEVMDGMILAGASAAGFSIGASIVYWWPMIADPGPQTNVSDWTLSIIGVGILRPVIITLSGAMVGAGVWRYMLRPSAPTAALSAIGGILGYLLLTLGSIQFQPQGNWPELLWTLVVAAGVFVLYRRALEQAVETDRQALGDADERMVCPSCHKVTPVGAFCAHCGSPLPAASGYPPQGFSSNDEDATTSS